MRKNNVTVRAFKRLWSYNPKFSPLKFLQIFFENISPYFNLWLSAEIVTALYEGRAKRELYLLVGITLFGNLLIRVIGAFLSRAVATQNGIRENNEAAAFNRKTLSLDYDKLENPEIRQHRRRIRENAHINYYGMTLLRFSVESFLRNLLNILFAAVLLFEMIALIAAVSFHWLSIVFLLSIFLCVTLQILYYAHFTKTLSAVWKKTSDCMLDENRYGNAYWRGQSAGMDNRIYKQDCLLAKLYQKFHRTHLRLFSEANKKSFLYTIPSLLISNCLNLFSYLLICFYCALGAFPVGSVIKYVGYLGRITDSIEGIFHDISKFKENEPYLKVYLDYFDIQNDMYQGSLAVEKRSDKKFDISFRNVSFRYAGTDRDAIKRINLDLRVGERLAVVGMNGSGKTTFIKLLCRLYDPTEGEVLMNDFNIRKYDYRQYLDLFSVVFQDFTLLPLPLGNVVASDAVWDARKAEKLLDEVGLGERYAQMPKKLETPLYKEFDEDGVNVSGGEAQKIALARALYKDAPFIILDEPTAALDPIAEAEIYAKFDEIVGDKTAIYISHRLSSCRFCDRIAVFDQGQIVQIGTHEELLADETGKYHELWYAQAQYYTEQ